MATNMNFNQVNEQIEKTVMGPMRAYATLAMDHLEKMAEVQYDAAKAYTDFGMQQMRSALDIKSPEDVQAYLQEQQKAAETMGNRLKGDAEKVVALNQEFAEKAQKTVEENAKTVTENASKAARSK